ncbi:hypothetical protein [Sulfobacillus harzensis]|uniref:Small multi-drug export protein n=1 Tax=Sulfobacillus harzensis TaxID=2729629 RepID=A0A7Y0L5U0_9FIRM|nr:hypothetical protein [Sulfobacillus harzensis]NMP23025.1 hypothetical protein [Sulfobacillus harzensis]
MTRTPRRHGWQRLLAGLGMGALFAAIAVVVGLSTGRPVQTLSLMGSSLVLECQPAAALAVVLGYPRAFGAAVAFFTNLAPLFIIAVGLDLIVAHWPWAARQVERAHRRAGWVARYGPLMFVPLCPVLGAYACVAIGRGLGFRLASTLSATIAGMVWSVMVIVYGGHWVVHLLVH